jgi:protein O-GlcNAc transferase
MPDDAGSEQSASPPQTIESAWEHYRAGRLAQAAAACRHILELDKAVADAHHLLGLIEIQEGRLPAALERMSAALALQASNPTLHNNLGCVLLRLERLEEAAHSFRNAVAIQPRYAEAHDNLGLALQGLRKIDEAAASHRAAIDLDSANAAAHRHLGVALGALGRPAHAVESLRCALALEPRDAQAHADLGNALTDLGRLHEAEQSYRQALALSPGYAAVHTNLGGLLQRAGRLGEAESCYRRALELEPGLAQAHNNLGNVLIDLGRLGEAEQALRRAAELKPGLVEALTNLASIFARQGKVDDAVAMNRRALSIDPRNATIHSNLIFALDLVDTSMAQQQEERHRWYAQHGRIHAASIEPYANSRDPARRLRIGYVSADFHRHSAYYVFAHVIRRRDRESFEAVCYSGTTREDECTRVLRGSADLWRSTIGLPDEALAQQIRADRIDILVDLSGHSSGNRLLVFARKPAPVQVTAWGYASGTGVESIDYFFADPVVVPADERACFAEEIVDLESMLCYEAPDYMPEVSRLPALAGGAFTFSCINRVPKISDPILGLWQAILDAVPGANLVIKDKELDDRGARRQLMARLRNAGIDEARARLLGGSPHPQHLESYHEIDMALDPFPHGGGVSSLEALWMGVPVVTLAGRTSTSRTTAAILSVAQMGDWIAGSEAEYVRIAVAKALDRQALARTRAGLRERMLASPAGDCDRYARRVEQSYREIWRRWCERSNG